MGWTNPRTYTDGEVLSKAELDVHIRDNLLYLKNLLGGNGDQIVTLNRTTTTEENILTLNNNGAGGTNAKAGLELRRSVNDNVAIRLRMVNAAYNSGWDITMPNSQTYLSFVQIGATEYLRLVANALLAPAGSAANPGIAFLGDATKGLYDAGTNLLGVSIGGTQRLSISATGIGVQATTGNGYGWIGVSSNIVYGGSETINFNPGGSTRMRAINSSTPYGETTPVIEVGGAQLNVITGNVVPVVIDRQTNDGVLLSFRQNTTEEGYVSVSGTTLTFQTFLGAHPTQLKPGQEEPPMGAVVVSTGERIRSENVMFIEDVADFDTDPNDKSERPRLRLRAVRQVLHERRDDPSWRERRGDSKDYLVYVEGTSRHQDPRVYGVWAGIVKEDAAGGSFGKNGHPVYSVAGVGLWECRVTDTGGDIEPGDMLCSSPRMYEAERQIPADEFRSFTLGKAHSRVQWDQVPVDPVLGYRWTMVTVALFAG